MTTEALLETVLNYPYLSSFMSYTSADSTFEIYYKTFNGFSELLSRSNVTEVLLDKYKQARVLTLYENKMARSDAKITANNYFRMMYETTYLEILIVGDQKQNGVYSEKHQTALLKLMEENTVKRKEEEYISSANFYSGFLSERAMRGLNFSGEPETLYTPNNYTVSASYNNMPELTSSQIDGYLYYKDSYFPNAVILDYPTVKYNCHSYAWYQQSTSNLYWINDPTPYMSDPYYSLYTGSARSGMKVYYADPDAHSGVIDYVTYSGNGYTYYVVSKWAENGLFRHELLDCPYADGGAIRYYTITGT